MNWTQVDILDKTSTRTTLVYKPVAWPCLEFRMVTVMRLYIGASPIRSFRRPKGVFVCDWPLL